MKRLHFHNPTTTFIPIDLYPDVYFREDLRKSFARSNTISSASADKKEEGEEWKEKGEGAAATVSI